MIIAFTGHRPPKGGLTYEPSVRNRLVELMVREHLQALDVHHVVVGGALGFDTIAARAAFNLGIPYHLFIPFHGFWSRWSVIDQRGFEAQMKHAAHVTTVSDRFSPASYQSRNVAMVQACDQLVAFWDRSPGGTANCVRYAESRGTPITFLDTTVQMNAPERSAQ